MAPQQPRLEEATRSPAQLLNIDVIHADVLRQTASCRTRSVRLPLLDLDTRVWHPACVPAELSAGDHAGRMCVLDSGRGAKDSAACL